MIMVYKLNKKELNVALYMFGCCKKHSPCEKPSCPKPEPDREELFYAQFGVNANFESGSNLSCFTVFNEGERITLEGNDRIILPAGYLYQINYVFLTTTEAGNYFQILPFLNDSPGILYSFFAPAGMQRNTSASGSFSTNLAIEKDAVLRLLLSFPDAVRLVDVSGAVSVTPYARTL